MKRWPLPETDTSPAWVFLMNELHEQIKELEKRVEEGVSGE